jgi:hypothetical protein
MFWQLYAGFMPDWLPAFSARIFSARIIPMCVSIVGLPVSTTSSRRLRCLLPFLALLPDLR